VVYVAVAADDVVGADLCTYYGKGFEGLRGAVLPGEMDDDVVGLAGVEVHGADEITRDGRAGAIGKRGGLLAFDDGEDGVRFVLIVFVGEGVGAFGGTGLH